MIRATASCAALLLAAAFSRGALAAPASGELRLESIYEFSTEPLTTERIVTLDPDGVNPHRQRWLLSHALQLRGLETVKLGKDRFGARVEGLDSKAVGRIRGATGEAPWFRPLSEFPCSAEPQPWFSTAEGAQRAVNAAAKEWERVLRAEKPRLAQRLSRIDAPSAELALKKALTEYDEWLHRVEEEWRDEGYARARAAEWKFYRAAAESEDLCKSAAPARVAVSWESMMEPPGKKAPEKPLIRAPARRWNGMYSVRLSVEIGGKTLNGQFLVDSGASRSVISPSWLESQGIHRAYVEVSSSPLRRVLWSGGGGLAHRAVVDRVVMSGHPLEIRDFALYETDFFGPPENIASCCDGILGADFLKNHVVEFGTGIPYEVRLWPRESFAAPFEGPWLEAHLSAQGGVVSDCRLKEKPHAVGVRWDTGRGKALTLHTPWSSPAISRATIECGGKSLGAGIPVTPGVSGASPLFEERYPAFDAGMTLLERGPFIFDLPNGRIWFSGKGLTESIRKNRTGLEVEFVEKRGERVLRVSGVRAGSAAAAFRDSGLVPGAQIFSMDGKPAEDLDLWEVEQRLAGAFGAKVALEWKSKTGPRGGEIRIP